MIYPLTPTTLRETELQRRPSLQEPTILHCQRAYEHVYRCVLKKKKSKALAGLEGSEAFIEAMPPLIGLDNVTNFIACVAYGVANGVILEDTTGPFLLRAAKCAMSAIALKAKLAPQTAHPKVPQPSVSRPKAAHPKAAQPKVAQPKAAQPKAAQPKVAQPAVDQLPVDQPTAAQPTESSPEPSDKPIQSPSENPSEKTAGNHNQLKPQVLAKSQFHSSLKTNKLHPPKKSENPHFSSENPHLESQNPPLPPQNSLPPSEKIIQQPTLECPSSPISDPLFTVQCSPSILSASQNCAPVELVERAAEGELRGR
jgi:hypothetical protein